MALEARVEMMWKAATLVCYLSCNNTTDTRLYWDMNHKDPVKMEMDFIILQTTYFYGGRDHVCSRGDVDKYKTTISCFRSLQPGG